MAPRAAAKRARDDDHFGSIERGEENEQLLGAVNAAFEGIDGYLIASKAQEERRSKNERLPGLTYGEVNVQSFASLLNGPAAFKCGERFVDLGCGTGKALCVAAHLGAESCLGIELVRPLAEAGQRAAERFFVGGQRVVTVKEGDMFETDWQSTADVVFVSTTCLDDDCMAKLSSAIGSLKPTARVITTTRQLPETSEWTLSHRGRYSYGKGAMTFHVYSKGGKRACQEEAAVETADSVPS